MAHTARSSRPMMLFLLLLCFLCWFSCFSAHVNNIYSGQTFLDIGFTMQSTVTNKFHHAYGTPMEIARPEGAHWTVISTGKRQRQRRVRTQKRGCHSGLWARLRKDPHRPTLPSMFLTNTQSLNKKIGWAETTQRCKPLHPWLLCSGNIHIYFILSQLFKYCIYTQDFYLKEAAQSAAAPWTPLRW